MNGAEHGRADTRAQYTQETIDLIRREAPQMGADEKIKRVQFGHQEEGGSVWIARDPKDIVDPEKTSVDGVDYYFGLFKFDETK